MSSYESDLFMRSSPVVLRNEGGYVCDPDDPGGETNMGITAETLKKAVESGVLPPDKDSVSKLSSLNAESIYRDMYFFPSGACRLNWPLCMMHLDCAVNCGVKGAVRILQNALNRFGGGLAVDGVFGPKTEQEFRRQWRAVGLKRLADAMSEERISYYERIVRRKPVMRKFLNGWKKRVERVRAEAGLP